MTLYFYFARKYILYFLYSLFVISLLSFIVDFIDKSRIYSSFNNVSVFYIFQISLYRLPLILQRTISFLVLFATIMTFITFSRSSEFIVARSIGYSIWRIVAPMIVIAIFVGGFRVFILSPIAAYSYSSFKTAEKIVENGTDNLSLNIDSSGLWLRQLKDDKVYIINSKNIFQDGNHLQLKDVDVYILGDDLLVSRIIAESAVIEGDYIQFYNLFTYKYSGEKSFSPYMKMKTLFTVKRIKASLQEPETLNFLSLPSFIKNLKMSGFAAGKYELHFYRTLLEVLLYIAMILIVTVFSSKSIRSANYLILSGLGVAAGFVIYFLNNVISVLLSSNGVPAFWAVSITPIFIIIVCTLVTLHKEDS